MKNRRRVFGHGWPTGFKSRDNHSINQSSSSSSSSTMGLRKDRGDRGREGGLEIPPPEGNGGEGGDRTVRDR